MKLNNLSKLGIRRKKRVGRGIGSGKGGHTVGRGQKGQRSRSGFSKMRSWIRESKIRSLPKLRGIGKGGSQRGYFKAKVKRIALNVGDLNRFVAGSIIDYNFLLESGLLQRGKKVEVKILGSGELKKKIILQGLPASEQAQKKIKAAGGDIR